MDEALLKPKKEKSLKELTLEELMDSLRPAGELFCLNSRDLTKLKEISHRVGKRKVLVHSMGFSLIRKVIPVTVIGFECYADAVTGTLYSRKTGKCMSSVFLTMDLSSIKIMS